MSKPANNTNQSALSKDGIRTRFDAIDELHLRAEARRLGYRNVQAYLKDLAKQDRISKQTPKK